MKRKFDILFESIMDELLQKSEVHYQLQDQFEKQVKSVLATLPVEKQLQYVKQLQRKHYSQSDKLQFLKNIQF